MRQAKVDGMSLTDISKTYGVAKSTVSLYCRDLYTYPTRKHQTETECRRLIMMRGSGKSHEGKLKNKCLDCGKPIRSDNHRCSKCYKVYQQDSGQIESLIAYGSKTRFSAESALKRYIERAKLNTTAPKPKINIKPVNSEPCVNSPSGYHHWIIDDSNYGICRYCKKCRQFPTFSEASITRCKVKFV